MTDAGPHSHTCATAESGTCHCECHGRQHGIVHVPKPKHGTITAKKLPGGGYEVSRSDTGLPPGGGTKAERQVARTAQVSVKTNDKPGGKAAAVAKAEHKLHTDELKNPYVGKDGTGKPEAEKIGKPAGKAGSPVLTDKQMAELDRQVAALPGETNSNRGGRTPRVVGEEYVKAVREGADLATIEKLGAELHKKTQTETRGPQRDGWERALDLVHRKTEERDTGVKPLGKGSVLIPAEHANLTQEISKLADDDGRPGALNVADTLSTRAIAQEWQKAVRAHDTGEIAKWRGLLGKRLQNKLVVDGKTRKNLQHAMNAVDLRGDTRDWAGRIRNHPKREEFPALKSVTPDEVHRLSLHTREGQADKPEDVTARLEHLRKTGEVLPPAREAKAKEAVAKKVEESGGKSLLNPEELYQLNQRVAGLTGTTRRGNRAPIAIGQDLANAVADGDAEKANKHADELTSALMDHRASPRTLTMWRNTLAPVRAQKPKTVFKPGPTQTPVARLLKHAVGGERDNDLFVRAAGAVDKERFDKLSEESRTTVLGKLERLGRGTGFTARDARDAHAVLTGGTPLKPGPEVLPRNVEDALKAVNNNHRSSGLPLSMLYADVHKDSYAKHFSPEQRASIRAKMTEIRAGMRDDAPDRAGVDRVIKDLGELDGAKAVEKPVVKPKVPRQPKMRGGEEVRWHGKTDSEVAADDARKAEEAKAAAANAVAGEVERGTPQPLGMSEARTRATDKHAYGQAIMLNRKLSEDFQRAGIDISPDLRDGLKGPFMTYVDKVRDAEARGVQADQLRHRHASLREGYHAYPDRKDLYEPALKQTAQDIRDAQDAHTAAVIEASHAAGELQKAVAGIYKANGKRKTPSAVNVPKPNDVGGRIDRKDNHANMAEADIARSIAPHLVDRPEIMASKQKLRQTAHELDKARAHEQAARKAASSARGTVNTLEGTNTHVPADHPNHQKWIDAQAAAGKAGAEHERATQATLKARKAHNEHIGQFQEDVRRAGQAHDAEQAAKKATLQAKQQAAIDKADVDRKAQSEKVKTALGISKDANRPNLEILTDDARKAMGGRTAKDHLDDLAAAYDDQVTSNPEVKRARALFNRSIDNAGRPTMAAINNLQQTLQQATKAKEHTHAAAAYQALPVEAHRKAVTNPQVMEALNNHLQAVRDLTAGLNGGAARHSRFTKDDKGVIAARDAARDQLNNNVDHTKQVLLDSANAIDMKRHIQLQDATRRGETQAMLSMLRPHPHSESEVRRMVDATTRPVPVETPAALRPYHEAVRNAKVEMDTHDAMKHAYFGRTDHTRYLGSDLMSQLTPGQRDALRADAQNASAKYDMHYESYMSARDAMNKAEVDRANAQRDYTVAGSAASADLVRGMREKLATIPHEPKSDMGKRTAKAAGVPRTVTKLQGRERELAREVNKRADILDEAENKSARWRQQANVVKQTHRELSGGKLHPDAQDQLDAMFDHAARGNAGGTEVYRENLNNAIAQWNAHQAEKNAKAAA